MRRGRERIKELEKSIKEEGCRDPLVVWQNTIVDGHHRYKICSENNIAFKTITREFASKDDAKFWMLKNQLSRRNLEPIQKIEAVHRWENLVSQRAKENEIKSGLNYGKGSADLPNPLEVTPITPVHTRAEMAKLAEDREPKSAFGKFREGG